jgi:hypothetical protein
MNLNIDFVRMLLEKTADPLMGLDITSLESFAKAAGLERAPTRGTPLCVCLMTYEAVLVRVERNDNPVLQNLASIEHVFSSAEEIVQLLLQLNPDEAALQLWNDLRARGDAALASMKHVLAQPKSMDQEEYGKLVDLSVLTEERPSGWTPGCETTDETALRTFLHYFRSDFEWPDP